MYLFWSITWNCKYLCTKYFIKVCFSLHNWSSWIYIFQLYFNRTQDLCWFLRNGSCWTIFLELSLNTNQCFEKYSKKALVTMLIQDILWATCNLPHLCLTAHGKWAFILLSSSAWWVALTVLQQMTINLVGKKTKWILHIIYQYLFVQGGGDYK